MAEATTITWHRHALLTDLQSAPVMVAPSGRPRVDWGFSTPGAKNVTQVSRRLMVNFKNGSTYDSGNVSSDAQFAELPVPSCEACVLTWRVCVGASNGAAGCSPAQQLFTTPSSSWKNLPMWAPANATGAGPQFAFFRATLTPKPSAALASALIFITADGPGCENAADKANRKLLGGYKLFLGDKLLGIGPGRSKCDTFGATNSPILCPHGIETIYDGYDVTARLAACSSSSSSRRSSGCQLFIESYAFDQPKFNISRRVMLTVRLRYEDGSVASLLDEPSAWESYDADSVYLGRLWEAGGGGHATTQRGSSGGGSWYYAPHEDLDTSRLPSGTPLSYQGTGAHAHGKWRPAVAKRPFPNLVVRRTPPVDVSYADATVTARGGGRYSFDMGRTKQGGIMLDAGALTTPCNVTVVFGEELKADGSVLSPMRTGSLYRDSWALAAGGRVRAQHHEYITGRFGELTFECAAPQQRQVPQPRVSMWVARARIGDANTRTAKTAAGAASMNSSSAELNAVWSLCQYTSLATSLDLFSDSNARQRSVDCMADDNTAMRLAYGTSAELALQRYAMLQALTVCGSLAKAGGGGGAQSCRSEWTVLPLIMARDDALHTGDLSFVRQHYDGLVASALGGLIDPSIGLVKSDQVLIDWPPGQRDHYVLSEYNSVANAFAYRGLRVLVELAGWLDRPDDAKKHARTAASLKASINAKMWNGTAFCDGICSNVSHTAFHSTMYLLAFGAVDDQHKASAWAYLRGRIDPPFGPPPPPPSTATPPAPVPEPVQVPLPSSSSSSSWPPPPPAGARLGMPCSSYTAQFAIQALYEGNLDDHGASALQVLTSDAKHTWRHMMAQGATTTMEAWDTDEKPNLTWSHVWSASPGFLIPWLLFGLQCLTPGCNTLRVRPAVGSLREGSYTLPTVKGPVVCRFTQRTSGLEVTLVLPVGIDASVALPRAATDDSLPSTILVNGAPWEGGVRDEGAHVVAMGLRAGEYVVRLA